MATKTKADNSDILEYLELITTRLDIIVNLLLDIMPEDSFRTRREFNAKLSRLDATRRVALRPFDAGRIFGRPSRDISSRRKEIAASKAKRGHASLKSPKKPKAKSESSTADEAQQ